MDSFMANFRERSEVVSYFVCFRFIFFIQTKYCIFFYSSTISFLAGTGVAAGAIRVREGQSVPGSRSIHRYCFPGTAFSSHDTESGTGGGLLVCPVSAAQLQVTN